VENVSGVVVRCVIVVVGGEEGMLCCNSFPYQTFNHRATPHTTNTGEISGLTGLVGSKVEITIEIQADLADGAGDKLVRDVTENCRTLKFTDLGFEEE